MHPRSLLVLGALLTIVAGCGGGGGGGGKPKPDRTPPTVSLTEVSVAGQTTEDATVTWSTKADEDPEPRRFRFSVRFGGPGEPVDPGPGGAPVAVDGTLVISDTLGNASSSALELVLEP